ncbi:hypothetical protein [Sphaerisporangium corydalis]|uniref:Serine/threonine protein kinase n=1 Tax=Sphaerisporangium corydalis TaxID=1441875 RepID=A0ABV9EF62_9ACTN|nr:hypothetical protein [Sphaerisporangium corydalis]
MKRLGPFHTLGAGAVLVVGLGVLSVTTAPRTDTAASSAPAAKVTTSVSPESAPPGQATPSAAPTDAAEPADPTPKRADYAGVAQGNGGLVALSIKNGKAIAYFCDGRIESWLKGTAENNTVTLAGKGSLITAALGNGKAQGRLQVGKAKWRFSAPLVKKPSGLYRATATVRGAKVVGGWIILPGGRQVGLLGVDEAPYPAPKLTPGSPVTVDGAELRPEDTDAFFDDL